MSPTPFLSHAIAQLASQDVTARTAAAQEIYNAGRASAEAALRGWWREKELGQLLHAPNPKITVGLAVRPETFARIHKANGAPHLATVPPEQDAKEFELHFPRGVALDILTTREPGGSGAIARYLGKLSEGVQQVEFHCDDVDRATSILREKFQIAPVYPETRAGADGTRINFFLMPLPTGEKVLIELWEKA